MAFHSLRWIGRWIRAKGWKCEKNGHSVDLKEKEINLILLIKFHIMVAWKPRMLSNLHHQLAQQRPEVRGVNFIVSISIQIVRWGSWRKHCTCHIRAFDHLMMTSFIHSYSISKARRKTAEQINSNSTRKNQRCSISEKANSRRGKEKHNSSFLCLRRLINFQAGQVGVLSALSPSLTDEKQCALFHYTVNPISCFTVCRRVAERGNEWDGKAEEMLTQIPQSLRRHQLVIGVQFRDSGQLTNQLWAW